MRELFSSILHSNRSIYYYCTIFYTSTTNSTSLLLSFFTISILLIILYLSRLFPFRLYGNVVFVVVVLLVVISSMYSVSVLLFAALCGQPRTFLWRMPMLQTYTH